MEWKDRKKTTGDKPDNIIGRNKPKKYLQKKGDSKGTRTRSSKSSKMGPSKITK